MSRKRPRHLGVGLGTTFISFETPALLFKVLLNAGLLEKTAEGRILFPFDAVRVNFVLKAA